MNSNKQDPNTYYRPPSNSSQFDQAGNSAGISAEKERQLVLYNHITYALYFFSYFTAGITWLFAILMNYIFRKEAGYSWLASHFDWQIKTFWYSIIFSAISICMMVFGAGALGFTFLSPELTGGSGWFGLFFIGSVLWVLTFFWHLYRIIRGWVALTDKRAL